MKIGIITYDKPHKKTQEVLFGLREIGYKKIKLLISKFKNFKNKKKIIFLIIDHINLRDLIIRNYLNFSELNIVILIIIMFLKI